ncbi:MAG: RNA polymerase sigma-70 factor [Bacteroidetes bacterium]|nr:RNA polymerase sigma-70 factor [Bacteroidota bacterium]
MKVDKNIIPDDKQFERLFRNLFEKYFLSLKVHAKHFTGNEDISEDFVQDTFTQLWEIRYSFDFHGSVKSYLYQTVQNKCINYLKRLKVEEKYRNFNKLKIREAELFSNDFIESHVGSILEKELSESIRNAVAGLPDRCKETFLLSREKGLTNKEIAIELGISTKAVERNMTRALSRLREILRNYLTITLIIYLFII